LGVNDGASVLLASGDGVVVDVGGLFEAGVLRVQVLLPVDEVVLADGEVLLLEGDLVLGVLEVDSVLVDLEGELVVLEVLGGDFVVEVLEVLGLSGLEGGEGVAEVLLDGEEEVLDLADGGGVSELHGLQVDEGLHEGAAGALLERVGDGGHLLVEGGLDLDERVLVLVAAEGDKETDGLVDGGDGALVLGLLVEEFGVGGVALGGEGDDGGLVVGDVLLELGDVVVQVVSVDVENVL